jgi:hypothetical protein
MNPGDLCLCGHTREVHFGRECSRVGCRCKEFAICDAAVDMFEALKVFVKYMEHAGEKSISRRSLEYPLHLAAAAIRKSKGDQ